MTKRQAKKICRMHPYGPLGRTGIRKPTWNEAQRKTSLEFFRCMRAGKRLTPGYRFGKWDPKASIAPWELPF